MLSFINEMYSEVGQILGQIIQEDEVMFAGASMEKVNLMKPAKQKRSMSIIKRLRDYISSNGKIQIPQCLFRITYSVPGQRRRHKRMFLCNSSSGSCGNCVHWRAEASEIQNDGGARRLEVATWSPVLGLAVKDDLFPHVAGGLRGRRVKITSIEVS